MKIWVLSDLHLTIGAARIGSDLIPIPSDAEVCVIAGDVCDGLAGIEWVGKTIANKLPVVMVLGNHDFFGEDLEGAVRAARDIAKQYPNITILDDSSIVIDGVKLCGGALWTNFELFANDADPITAEICGGYAKREMPDFGEIYATPRQSGFIARLVQPRDLIRTHRSTVDFLEGELAGSKNSRTVVVTHHAPHRNSIHRKFEREPTSASFASDLSSLIHRSRPSHWIHGHVHHSLDYELEATRVLCNPRGYHNSRNVDFNPDLVIEV